MYIVLQVSPCKFRILQQRELTSQTLHTDTQKDVNPFQLAKPEIDHICSSINQVTWLFYLLETLFLWLIENSLFLYIHTCSGIQNSLCFETIKLHSIQIDIQNFHSLCFENKLHSIQIDNRLQHSLLIFNFFSFFFYLKISIYMDLFWGLK